MAPVTLANPATGGFGGRAGQTPCPATAASITDRRMSRHSSLMLWVDDEAGARGVHRSTVIADAVEHYMTNTIWAAGPSTREGEEDGTAAHL